MPLRLIMMLMCVCMLQVGAAFSVLQLPMADAAAPLELQAAKSRLLHTEPSAGALGLAMLSARLQHMPGHIMPHLRTVNPHVAAIFQVSLPKDQHSRFPMCPDHLRRTADFAWPPLCVSACYAFYRAMSK